MSTANRADTKCAVPRCPAYCFALEQDGYNVILHSGVRRAESEERRSLPFIDIDSFTGLMVRRPLLDLSIEDVWQGLKTGAFSRLI